MPENNFEFLIEENSKGSRSTPEQEAVITGLTQERVYLEVPEFLEGLPVRRIAPHAFREQQHLRSLSLPRNLRSVGAFALYNCPELEEVDLHDGITDFHNGVFRHDLRLRRIRIHINGDNPGGSFTVMKDILSESDTRLQFCLLFPDGEARLTFPGYLYAFNENTMARTIQFSITGSGMVYRECVRRKGVGFREYDRLFSRVVLDDPQAAVEIAVDRLLFPYNLAPEHRQAYEDHLRVNAREALLQFLQQMRGGTSHAFSEEGILRLRMMADRGFVSADAADDALREASALGLTEACSIILAGRDKTEKENGTSSSGEFTLDDW